MQQTVNRFRYVEFPDREFEAIKQENGDVCFRQVTPDLTRSNASTSYADCALIVSAFTKYCFDERLQPCGELAESLLLVLQTEGRCNLWAKTK